jgi:hypothetical protein
MPRWWNRQTRHLEGVVGESPWEFKSPPRHHHRTTHEGSGLYGGSGSISTRSLRTARVGEIIWIVVSCDNQKKAVESAQSGSSSAVECFLAKEEVAGSNPVFRSSDFVGGAV